MNWVPATSFLQQLDISFWKSSENQIGAEEDSAYTVQCLTGSLEGQGEIGKVTEIVRKKGPCGFGFYKLQKNVKEEEEEAYQAPGYGNM